MSGQASGADTARHYLAAHERLVRLATALTAEQAATPVAGTPGWTVHDALAHLAALPTDALAGRVTGPPSAEVTAGQVAERRERSVDELVAEWTLNAQQMADLAVAGIAPPHLAVDALTHEQDIRGALGLPCVIDGDELRFCMDLYAWGCGQALQQAQLPALRMVATDTDFAVTAGAGAGAGAGGGAGDVGATVRAPEFELFRGLSGRRSRAQVAAFDWDGDASPYLDRFNVFGPLPADDIED